MGSFKLQSFSAFAEAKHAAANKQLREEQEAARNTSADSYRNLLQEFGVTSVKELKNEDRAKFFEKLAGEQITESVAVIEEGTRSQIGKIAKNGKITSVYMHYDGYPDHMLPQIKKGYKDGKNVDILLKKGGGSFLEADPSKINFYGDKAQLKGDAKNMEKYIKGASYDGGAEYVYLYDERDGKWYMADVYAETGLQPAFEHFMVNEKFVPSKGNVRDAKKVSKALENIMIEGSALTADSTTHLGAIKYLCMNALEDANFHSYIEPVSKKIGGKIQTIMITVDNLGNKELPVGAKHIKDFLDARYSKLSSAAGWSGIGIVEGIAMYLDGWGFSKQAQSIVDEFNLIWANESVVTEGNAFLAARAKAIEEDAEEFEFNGKTYPVIKANLNEGLKQDVKAYQRRRELGYNDQFHGDESLSYTLSLDLGMDPKNEFGGGDWLGFDHVSLYVNGGKKEGTILDDALTGKYTYDELKSAAAEFLGIKESVNEAEVKSDEEFKEYAFSVLQQAFGDDFDEAKAQEVVDGLLGKVKDGDYGEAIGRLQASLGESKEVEEVSEGMHPKIKKAMKAVEDGETVYGENIRFPGRFKILNIDKSGFATVDYMDGTDPMQMASMNIRIDSLSFESVEAIEEAEVKSDEEFKEYAFSVLQKAFGDDFDEAKAQEVVDGLLGKVKDGDYGEAIGRLQASLGESVTNEAEVKSDEDFKEYAFSVLQKAFGDKFEEEKAQEVVDGLLGKHGDDYGAAVGALQSSLG